MAKEIHEVNESRSNPARATAASAPAARILVIEDEAALSMLLSYNLEAEGFTVDRVERGDEAEIRLSETIPDLVILDWMLPGVSGLEICRRMRARETTSDHTDRPREESERVRGTAFGGSRRKSTSALSTFISDDCARHLSKWKWRRQPAGRRPRAGRINRLSIRFCRGARTAILPGKCAGS
jgi:hypothetical protein